MAAGLLAATGMTPSAAPPRPEPTHANAVSVSASALPHRGVPSVPGPGEVAPDFVYQSSDWLWQNLSNMLEERHVLLVFGAGETDLMRLERDREALGRMGVVPVAVCERRDREAFRLVQRLALGYSLLADPRGVIGEQYAVLDPHTHASRPAWFVIDREGRVRDRGEGLRPAMDWGTVSASALGLEPAGVSAISTD
jgi:peroxiredoxin